MSYIYESPDNGDTVYRRKIGEDQRILHHVSERNKELRRQQDRWIMWQDILHASDTNPELQKELDRVQVLYELTRKP